MALRYRVITVNKKMIEEIKIIEQKIEGLKETILHHEKTIDRIDNKETNFRKPDWKKAKSEAEKMIKEYSEKIESLEKEKNNLKKLEK